MLVGIQTKEDAIEKRRSVILCFEVAVKFEELWKEGKDERERYLEHLSRELHWERYVIGTHQIEQQGDEDDP